MQPMQHQAQAAEQPAALSALAEVAIHPPAPPSDELSVEVRGHSIRRPPMVAPEARSPP
jgi:hypothetical protein